MADLVADYLAAAGAHRAAKAKFAKSQNANNQAAKNDTGQAVADARNAMREAVQSGDLSELEAQAAFARSKREAAS